MSDLSLEIVAVVLACGTFGYFSTLLRRKCEFSIIRLLTLFLVLLLVIAPVMWLWQKSSESINDMSATAHWAGLLRSVTVSLIISVCTLIMACQKRSGTIGSGLAKCLHCRLRDRHAESGGAK
jgi:EamA domain-containing membrane protein RarD